MGIEIVGTVITEIHFEGGLEMLLDATQHYHKRLTYKRLFGWHAALFSTGRIVMYKIKKATWRDDSIQVAFGPMGKETVHFEAPSADKVTIEIKTFLDWFNPN